MSRLKDHAAFANELSFARGALVRLLGDALGDERRAQAALVAALEDAARGELPETPREVLWFAKAHVVEALSMMVGPRLALALLAHLATELGLSEDEHDLEPSPGAGAGAPSRATVTRPPASAARTRTSKANTSSGGTRSRPAALLVDTNRLDRASLARSLVRHGCDVAVADALDEVRSAVATDEPPTVAVVDLDHPRVHDILEQLAHAVPPIPVVARARSFAGAGPVLSAAGVTRFEVRLRDAPPEEILDVVHRITRSSLWP